MLPRLLYGPTQLLKKSASCGNCQGSAGEVALTAIEKQCVSCIVWTQGAADAYVWPKQLSKKCFRLSCMGPESCPSSAAEVCVSSQAAIQNMMPAVEDGPRELP